MCPGHVTRVAVPAKLGARHRTAPCAANCCRRLIPGPYASRPMPRASASTTAASLLLPQPCCEPLSQPLLLSACAPSSSAGVWPGHERGRPELPGSGRRAGSGAGEGCLRGAAARRRAWPWPLLPEAAGNGDRAGLDDGCRRGHQASAWGNPKLVGVQRDWEACWFAGWCVSAGRPGSAAA